jgi:hypothetical protein
MVKSNHSEKFRQPLAPTYALNHGKERRKAEFCPAIATQMQDNTEICFGKRFNLV